MAKTIWLYCTACERAFQANSKNTCKYDRCDGHLGDIWGWEVARELNHDYPKIPIPGTEYPLFSDRNLDNPRRCVETDGAPVGTLKPKVLPRVSDHCLTNPILRHSILLNTGDETPATGDPVALLYFSKPGSWKI